MNIKKKLLVFVFLLAFFLGSMGQEVAAFARFQDDATIPTWAIEAVDTVREESIMTGFGDQTFRPNQSLNRAEALVVLFRTKGIDLSEGTTVRPNNFSDVPKGEWFAKEVGEAVHLEWITGFPDGTFRPGKVMNKAEWAVLVMRAFGLERQEDPGFRDVPSNVWYTEAVFSLTANDLLRTKGQNFMPSDPVSRADAAWIMAEILKKPRLMGESKSNDFASYARRVDSRRTAIRPKNFNAEQQGYDIEKKELQFNVVPREDSILIRQDSDWLEMGTLEVTNALEDKAQLHSLEFKFLFEETDVGPEANFTFRIVGRGFEKEQDVGPTGNIFIPGIEMYIDPEEEVEFTIWLKPRSETSFYAREGAGRLSLFLVTGSMISTFNRENPDRNGSFRAAPSSIEGRDFTSIIFRP